MTKYDYLGMRRKAYSLAGTIGTFAELNAIPELNYAYRSLSDALDEIDQLGYKLKYIDPDTNEIVEGKK